MKLISTKLTNIVALEQSHHRHKVCKLGGDKLHRPPVVALIEAALLTLIDVLTVHASLLLVAWPYLHDLCSTSLKSTFSNINYAMCGYAGSNFSTEISGTQNLVVDQTALN